MGKGAACLAILVLLAGCHRKTAAETEADNARAVAMVEAAQHSVPPPRPVVPSALPLDEVRRSGFADDACGFADPAHAAGATIAAISASRALMRLDGDEAVFAADPGAQLIEPHAYAHYTGKRFTLRIERVAQLGATPIATATPLPGKHATTLPVTLKLTDEHDRPVLTSEGLLTCNR